MLNYFLKFLSQEKSGRTPFESDDSFGKFTADMMQQYVHEEEVRTKHQAAILRLREKSLKEKTKAELQWLERMKKQSRDKGSDDVMPSIKKRERGIRMKLKAEKVGGQTFDHFDVTLRRILLYGLCSIAILCLPCQVQ